MRKLKKDVLEFLRHNTRARHAIAELFTDSKGARLSDSTVYRWLRDNDPRLTCLDVLELISHWMDKSINSLVTSNEPEV